MIATDLGRSVIVLISVVSTIKPWNKEFYVRDRMRERERHLEKIKINLYKFNRNTRGYLFWSIGSWPCLCIYEQETKEERREWESERVKMNFEWPVAKHTWADDNSMHPDGRQTRTMVLASPSSSSAGSTSSAEPMYRSTPLAGSVCRVKSQWVLCWHRWDIEDSSSIYIDIIDSMYIDIIVNICL